jgi:TolA-binding protein
MLAALAVLASSCAYYNTFYLARKYYLTGTAGLPYPVDKPTGAQTGNYQKSIDYAKKVLANYPKSKWVDDAYLMWARSLLGKDDPIQAATMLQDFPTRFPSSPLKNEATFYLGVAYRQGHKYREAMVPLDEYLEKAPQGELAPYAHLERARSLMSLARYDEAAQAASRVIEGSPNSPLAVQARGTRAEALLASGDRERARADFAALGLRARDDDERFVYLLREADCLEAARDYTGELALLDDALSHETKPVKGPAGTVVTGAGGDRYGRLTLRSGTVHLLAGRHEQALTLYRNVIQDYPKTALAAEAQYRIGYAYETVLDDFDGARQEYAKVRDQSMSSAFYAQANARQGSLDRLARYRSAGGDSLGRKVEAGFLLAEQYLFELDKPERALDAYAQIARENAGTPWAAKALNAQAWVLRRKLDRPAEADSLLWAVVHGYPATEAQLAARDYLESAGHEVPSDLIKMPETQLAVADTALPLTPPPAVTAPLGVVSPVASPGIAPMVAGSDSLLHGPYGATIGPLQRAPGTTAGGVASPGAPAAPSSPAVTGPRETAPADAVRSPAAPAGAGRAGSPLDDPPRPPPPPRDSSGVRP